ncbi:hypothetical protein CNMCM6069_007405 [Aspergillus lentulus]|nr:hypothetical protein CNMCM6069_007405 [Aspergillus lentulus]
MDTMKRKHQGLFPVLNDGGREPSVTVNEISSEARERATAYTARRGYDIVHFLRAVWSIVLQQFLETDLVCFVFFDHSGVQVCEVPVSREEPIPNLLERIAELRPLPSALCEKTRMNTGLLIGDTSLEVNRTAVLDTFRRIQKDNQPCDCLLVLEGEPPHRLVLVATTTLLSSDQATAVASTVSQVMVEMSAEDNSRTVGDLSLLSEHNQQCLVRWNNFQAPSTNTDSSILDTIRAKALSQPEATAIHSPDVIMTYHELDTISNKLAVHLRLLGVRPDILVPFLFQRCHWVIVVQLAVLKAGGAFVPLEPAHPNARLAEITKRTNCGFLLTSDANAGRAALLAEKVVCINHSLMSSLPTDFTTYRLVPLSSPSSPAYVLFTSGSTGQPKGCVVDCRAMAQIPNQAVVQSMGLSSSTRVLQFASYTFAISIFEIYYALSSGATICMPTDHDRINSLATVMDEMKITWACMTPSLLRTLDPERSPATLKRVFLGGEPVVKGEFEAWAAIVDLVYVYGASEVSGAIGFTDHQCDGNDIAYRAFPGMRFWISDALDYHKLAPVGVTGELILEGPALAQRYLDDVQSTLTAFIDPPLWRQSLGLPTVGAASRMYKTGDLFRYAHDGSVIHVGRKGTQVKIRGKRLDLGEVEFHVSKCCPNVARVIAETAAPLDANGVPALVLFLYYSADDAGERNEETTPQTLFAAASERFQSIVQSTQTKLEQTLPDHMLPSFYLPLASIPMTVTGKVDRRALRESVQKCTRRELEAYQPTGVVELVPPETVLEKALHAVFAQVLRIDGATFGVHHSFIRLGGDSLAAMRAVGLLTTKEYNVTVADILGQPTRASAAASAPPPFSLLAGGHDETVASAAQQCGMSISAIEDCYPCTALQQGLMISTMRVPGRYIARCVFDLARGLDLERLKAAWQQTVDANVILRTRIVRRASGDLIQAVLGRQVSAIQWQSYPTVGAYKMEDAVIPMQPGDALARFALIGDTFSGWSLGLTLHHAIFDAHSLGLLLEQTQQAYYGASLDPNLFSPFIEMVQKQDGASEREFWTATFADIHAPVFPSLPHDRAVPRASTHLERTIPLLSRTGSGITLSNVARLAWAIVVSAHTDSEDVVFGVTVNGRATATAGAQDMTGPTIATVPFPVRCQKQKKVADVLEAVQSLAISMMAFEQTGLQKIRQMSPQAAAACDFQSQLIFQRPAALDPSHQDDAPPIMVGKTALQGLEDFSVFIDYVIGLVCTPSAGNESLHISAYFDREILPGYMAERMMGQFANVLQQLCAGQHDRVVGELELVSVEDRKLLTQWNGVCLPVEISRTLHDVVLQNAQKEPLMPAVSSWDRGLTYRELDVLSATIAQTIIMQAGVKERDRVALCFEKSVWPVLSMLAVLRAGATAVNIDPTLPPARISAILEVSNPSLILASSEMGPMMRDLQTGLPVIEISQTSVPMTTTTTEEAAQIQWPTVQPNDVAFILFTSGSTGTPKGIVIEHRHFTTAFHHHRDALYAHPGMRALHFCSYAWDVSLQEIFFTWVHGGCLCIPSEEQRLSNLAGFIREHQVNWAIMTPSASTILRPQSVPGLETLVLAGEPIPLELMELWSSRLRLLNGYGPAEAFTCAFNRIEPGSHHPGLFGPMCGVVGWVTVPDNVDRLAALGAVGELLIEGPTVTRGYLDLPELSREAFIDAPEWLRKIRPGVKPGRLFRSGDLVRVAEGGCFQYLGRKDTQVKVRGQRVVLTDVEHQVRLHFVGAQQVVAEVVQPQGSAAVMLVAFVYTAPVQGHEEKTQLLLREPDENFLQACAAAVARLEGVLPAHMIPTAMCPLYRVPYGATSKIDRRQLRQAAERLTPEQLQSYTTGVADTCNNVSKDPPVSAAEKTWQALWARVLGVPTQRIGRDDLFFRLGGDSLSVIRLLDLAGQEGLPHLTFQDVLQNPRLREIAALSETRDSSRGSDDNDDGPAPFALVKDADALLRVASEQCETPIETIEDIYPCTPLQANLIAATVHQRGAYVRLNAYTLVPDIDIERLQQAWAVTAKCNPILRTRIFQTPDGSSYQAVLNSPLNWSHHETPDDVFASQPVMGLGTPLAHLMLSPGHLHLVIHHALYDGWSLSLLVAEVDKAYLGLPLLPAAKFNNFIAHVESSMQSAGAFWKQELKDSPSVHFPALPSLTHRPQPRISMSRIIDLPDNPTQSNVTVASKIKLAWALVSRAYTNNSDTVTGFVSSGRTAPVAGIVKVPGPTIASVPLRIRLGATQRVCEALEAVQAQFVKQTQYEHLGLQNISQQSEGGAAACQFQTLIAVEAKEHEVQGAGERHTWFCGEKVLSDINKFSSHALMLQCQTRPGGGAIEVTATFDPEVLASEQMHRVLAQLDHFLVQIQAVSEASATTIADLDILSDEDLQQLLRWNALPLPPTPWGCNRCVHDLVHDACQRRPAAVAIEAWDGQFTYQQIDDHVADLAHRIQTLGVVRPDTFVGLYMEKSRWTVVAQLAVLRAGGAFTMLEPSQPLQRLRELCAITQLPLILTTEDQQEAVAGLFSLPVLGVGNTLLKQRPLCLETGCTRVKPSNAMYTIATSGTTGKPKVAVIEHGCFIANIQPIIDAVGINADSRVLQFAGYGFDAMLIEHMITLLVGGCICIPSGFDRDNRLAEVITEMGANWAMLTASVIQLLTPTNVPTLTTLVQAGEPMQQSIVDRWASHVRLMNAYGPSECTILSCVQNCIPPGAAPYDIGYATGGVTWVVDPDTLDPVPIGAEGELIIEGDIVGRGYLNDLERTAAAFIPCPHWLADLRRSSNANGTEPGPGTQLHRVYRTGDLVRYTPRGSIAYIRRKDSQIKLRGQRLELTEVEHHVQQTFPGALQVVAAVSTLGGTGNAVLFALVLCAPDAAQRSAATDTDRTDILLPASNPDFHKAVETTELALVERVPAYMVPSIFIPLSRVPRDNNGKVDRRLINARLSSLSRKEADGYSPSSSAASTIVAPQNKLQHDIRAIWAGVLGMADEDIGIHNSFFRIGGDSITSMQVVARCRSAGIDITMRDVFKHRTISQLALHATRKDDGEKRALPSEEEADVGLDHAVSLSPIQQMYFDYALENPNHFSQSVFLHLEGPGVGGAESMARALAVIVETHPMLRARFEKSSDGTWRQRVTGNADQSNYRYYHHGVTSQEQIKSICSASQQALDIRHGPLLIIDQFERDDATKWLFLVAHHLVIDLVSWRVVLADLEQLLTTGERPKVPPTSFLRWCQLQADYAARLSAPHQVEEDQETDISAYWGKGVTRNTHRDVDRYALILDKQTSELLLTKANIALNTQPVEIVQAALLHSFVHLFPDRPAPIIFSEGHGREPWDATIDITRTVGWFTTICPAQVSLDASEDFVTALRRTKDARRRSPANGWEHFTARYLHPQGPKTMKGMEILFNYQGRYQQLERPDAMLKIDMANQFTAGDVAPDMQRFAPIEVSAQVADDCLRVEFQFNRHMRHQDRLYQWGPVCERSLRQAAAQLTGMSGHIQTVSDFPLGSSHVTSDLLDETLRTMRTRLANGRQLIVQDVYPCTPIQQGMLMGYTRTPWHYEQVLTWRVVGASLRDVARLQAAWQHVVNAHPALRTVFLQTSDGHIEQLVLQDYTPVVRIHQDSSHQSHAPEPEPVSLDALKPLHELHVHTSSTSGDVVLRLHINHALVDGTSTKILRRDLVCAYEGQPLPTMMLESQSYRDYVEYMLTQAASLKSHQYWQSHLQGALPCLVPSLQGHDGSNDLPQRVSTIRSFTMELGPTEALDTFCEVHELALTVLFHVAWALVVKQYTASEDVCFGYIASARHAPVQGIDDMVGPLINMLVGRIDMPAGMTLLSVLQQYNRTYLHSLEHQHQPLAEALNAIGSTSGKLFNTLLTVQYQQDPRKDAAGDPSGIVLLDEDMEDKSEYPVTLNVAVFPDRVELLFSHHTAHMSDWYAARMARCFRHALAEVLTHPSLPVGEIQVVDDSQRQQILQRNEPLADPVNTCVHHIIHQRCLDFPASAAVCSWDGEFTYEELDTVSSALAEELIDYSIGVDMTIPVLLEKSRWVPVAVLGILKTGASFVLMDASHPEARLRGLCEDVQAPLILASRGTFSKASNLAPHVVCLGERLLGEIACPHPARWTRVPVCASNAAYTVFTSGSTGKPKGAILDHSCLATAAKHLHSCMYMNSASRVLQFSSHAWDIAVADIVLTLLAGGCVCIPSEEERTGDIAAAVNRMRVNWAILTPTVSRLVKPGDLKHLQTLVLAGEPLSPSDLAIWHDKVQLISAYGPAECCPISTVSEPLTASSNPRDIGRPPANVAWIVDRDNHARLVPEGVVGELLLEGPTVGRGYVNNAQQTAAAFIDPPLWLRGLRHGQSSTRLYKTGDLARFTPDGRLIFVGRKDNQIKIRGQRLELGEVEAQAGIAFLNRDVTVELVGQADDAFLVAFVHPMADDHESPAAGTGSLLRQPHSQQFQESVRAAISTLREALPSYMVPTAFLPLAWVPKSPTGKTDRKRLIELAASLSQSELDVYSGTNATRRTPSTPLEAQLQDLVARVLKRSPGSIALDEDLFHIGLDSLRAMTLASLAAKEGLKLLALTIFQHPRLSQLAAVLEEGARAAAVSSTTSSSPQSTPNPLLDSVDDLCTKWKIDRSQVADVLPTTFYQRGSLDCQHLAHMVLTFSQPVDLARLQSVVVAAIRHYDILRTVFVPFENTTVQLILHKMSLPTVEIQTDKDLQSTVQSLCQQDIQTPIPPGHPVTRLFFVISRKQEDNHLAMILRLHHAQYDGVSIRRIHNYITAAYEDPTHPPLTTAGYADFLNARRHHQHASTFQFWRDLLHGSTMTCLAPGGGHISTTTHRHRMDLLVTSAREIPRPRLQPGLTMATYLKAAWALVLAAQTHTHDLVFAQLVSGRNLPVPDIDRIVGPCINYIPVRVTLQPTWTCSELLRNVQAQHIRTMAHDAVDFDELVARSTAWPAGTEIGTGVHFLHGDRFWDEVRAVDGVECRSQHIDFKLLQTYPMLTCTGSPDAEEATGRSVLGVALTSAVFGQEVADRVFEVFLGMLDYLTTTPERLVAEVIA